MEKKSWVSLIILLVIIVFSIYVLTKDKTHEGVNEKFSKCLAEKSFLYTQLGCHACKIQEEMFGNYYKNLNVVDCTSETLKCSEKGIQVTPTWIINNEIYPGVQTIEKLKEITDC